MISRRLLWLEKAADFHTDLCMLKACLSYCSLTVASLSVADTTIPDKENLSTYLLEGTVSVEDEFQSLKNVSLNNAF